MKNIHINNYTAAVIEFIFQLASLFHVFYFDFQVELVVVVVAVLVLGALLVL